MRLGVAAEQLLHGRAGGGESDVEVKRAARKELEPLEQSGASLEELARRGS